MPPRRRFPVSCNRSATRGRTLSIHLLISAEGVREPSSCSRGALNYTLQFVLNRRPSLSSKGFPFVLLWSLFLKCAHAVDRRGWVGEFHGGVLALWKGKLLKKNVVSFLRFYQIVVVLASLMKNHFLIGALRHYREFKNLNAKNLQTNSALKSKVPMHVCYWQILPNEQQSLKNRTKI